MKTRTKKLLSILLLICMIVSMIPVVASAATPSTLYLVPNSNWTQGNARFAAYFWNNSGSEKWVSAVLGDSGYYEVTVPSGYPYVIFCRMNPNYSTNSWNYAWNQTADLTVPTDGTNCYTVKAGTWNKGGGTWSTVTVESEETEPTTAPTTAPSTSDKEYYLIGYIDGANYGDGEDHANLGDYKFVNGTVTVTFKKTSYVCVKSADMVWYMTDGWLGSVTSATLYNTSTTTATDPTNDPFNKLQVPAGTVTFTLVENSNGTLTLSYTTGGSGTDTTEPTETEPSTTEPSATEPSGSASDYYLFGYINGTSYGENDDYATLGKYKFVNGKLTCTFPTDSYVGVKTGDLSTWYMTDGWLGGVRTATLYDTGVYTASSQFDKLMVPGGIELTFTLTVNSDNTVTLSYVTNNRPGYTDASGIQDGVTLHAWNWSFNAIKENMALIASQGYTAVQTAPIQPVKESTSGKDMNGVWWVQYQPIDFVINTATDNPIGTASEFAAMCAEAEKYGVKVIVDVVANHMANATSNNLSSAIPAYLRNDTSIWHDYTVNTTDYTNRYDITQHCMAGIPDLNTASTKLQGYVISFLKECIDAGADGFRFDGAKHIETPDDDSTFASNFWPNVIGAAEDYAASLGREIYVYGELLDMPGGDKLPILAYTKYMAVTDNSWGNSLRGAVTGGNASFISTGYNKPAESDQLVVWAESHDTYATSDSGASSYNVSVANINKTWALVAARANIMGLYFARPSNFYSTTMGTASLNTGWDYAEVKAVNQFHNAFVGQGEKVGYASNIAIVIRGTTGIVLVNVSGTTKSVSISGTGMTSGTYTDQISGNTFTVSSGKITGTIGSTGIAVIYNPSASHTHSYTAVVTAPTCVNGGYTTYTCSCGDSYTGNQTAATGHSFVNGTCTKCGAVDSNESESDSLALPTLKGASFSLSFEAEILVNFYYTVSDMTNVVEQGMMVFYTNPVSADITKANDVYTGSTPSGTMYVNTTAGIAAKEMGDYRYYAAYAKLANGTYAYSPLYQYSPRKYATNMLAKSSTSDTQKALCVAMLNFGAAAQKYFGYKTDDLMNSDLTAAQQALVVAYDSSYFTGAVAASSSKTTNFTKTSTGFSARSASVSFEGAFAINYYFTPSATVKNNVTLYFWTPADYAAATRLTTSNASGSMSMTAAGDGSYWGQISGIAAKYLDNTYYVAGVYTDTSGNTYCTGVIAYSLSRYCMNNAVDGNEMQELAAATAMYGYYAKAHFAS